MARVASCTRQLLAAARAHDGGLLAESAAEMVRQALGLRSACTDAAASLLITRAATPAPPPAPGAQSPPPNLSLASILPMVRLAWQDSSLELDDVECVVVSLIDQVSALSCVARAALTPLRRASSRATSSTRRAGSCLPAARRSAFRRWAACGSSTALLNAWVHKTQSR